MLKRHRLTAIFTIIAIPAIAVSAIADGDDATITVAGTAVATKDVDLDAADQIFQKSCRACHGNKAQGAASFPKLSDKAPQYIAEKLEIYRSGEKIGPNSILMIQHAKKLSDDDIANLSVYVTSAFD